MSDNRFSASSTKTPKVFLNVAVDSKAITDPIELTKYLDKLEKLFVNPSCLQLFMSKDNKPTIMIEL